jgi:hypothetical protein
MNHLDEWLAQADNTVRAPNDWKAITKLFQQRGWGDGLPIVPPTPERVQATLAYCDRRWDHPVAKMAPRYGDATPIRIAINAVMAGCEPEYFPIIVAAIEAMCDPAFNLYAIQATTHLCAPLVIVNGPIAAELEINGGINAFGPGKQANSTIGRAIRLALVNIGGGVPGAGDMATFGAPSKFSYCVAENETDSPWQPLHVDRGCAPGTSSVTVVGAEPLHNVNDHASTTAIGILRMIAGTMRTTGNNDVYNYQDGTYPQPLVVFGPEHAKTVADGGYDKQAVRQYLFEQAHMPLGDFSQENIDIRFRRKYGDAPLETRVPVFKRPEDLLIAVIGGPGKHSAVIPTFGATRAVTKTLTRIDGNPAQSIQELKFH